MTRTGGCICGAVRYKLLDDPLFVHVCHCTECQRDSGGAFQVTALMLAKDFQLTGQECTYSYVTRKSGNNYKQYRCEVCCCTLAGINTSQATVMVVRPGTIDDTSDVRPGAHIWTREKQSWFAIPDDVPSFEEEYDYTQLWPKTSLDRIAGT